MMRKSPYLQSILRYLASGVSSSFVQFGVLILFVELLEQDSTLSSSAAFMSGCFINYLLLYYWAFNSEEKHFIVVLKYIVVAGITLGLNVLIFWALTEKLHFWYLFSQLFSTLFVAAVNLFLNKYYTFSQSGEGAS